MSKRKPNLKKGICNKGDRLQMNTYCLKYCNKEGSNFSSIFLIINKWVSEKLESDLN
jgi:hypothetical protein